MAVFRARLGLIEELITLSKIAVHDVAPHLLEPMLFFTNTSTRHAMRLAVEVKYPEDGQRRGEHVLTVATRGSRLVVFASHEMPLTDPIDRQAVLGFVRQAASGRFGRIVDHYKVTRCIAASSFDWHLQVHQDRRNEEDAVSVTLRIPAREFVRLATNYPEAFGIPKPVTDALTAWERLGKDDPPDIF